MHDTSKQMKPTARSAGKKNLCLLLAALIFCACLPAWGPSASAAGTPTSLGLAQHGINAYNEGWQYSYGGKGEMVNGVRASDCAGLIYAYFSDLGVGGCMGGATGQATQNCILTGNLSDGLPRIHGLALTILEPGATDDYSHIGIYIGNEESCENSDYGTNMVRGSIWRRSWTTWHLFDNGVKYPRSGWYEFDEGMVHYTNYQYDVNTTVDGYTIGSDGFARLDDGTLAPVDFSLLSTAYVSAEEVRQWLTTNGWDDGSNFDYNAKVRGANSVNLRSEPSTSASVVTVLANGSRLHIDGPAVEGGEVRPEGGSATTKWYPATTASGRSGYISEAYVEMVVTAPIITSDGEAVTLDAGGYTDYIYYTTDGSDPVDGFYPSESSHPYTGPVYELSCTYKAAVITDTAGPVTTATITSNGTLFTDFTYKNWYAPYVDKSVAMGLFGGIGNNCFGPNNTLTRSQLIKVLANMSGEDIKSYDFGDDCPAFEDVSPNAYYYHDLAWAVQAGIVTKASKFYPNADIPREQVCVMLNGFAKYLGIDLNSEQGELFADDDKISSWAKDAVYRMRNTGIISGTGNNNVEPKGTSTRATACTMLVNFYQNVVALHDTSGGNLPATRV